MAERILKSPEGRFYIDGLTSEDVAHRRAASIRTAERDTQITSSGEGINRRHRVWISMRDGRPVAESEARELADMLGIEFSDRR